MTAHQRLMALFPAASEAFVDALVNGVHVNVTGGSQSAVNSSHDATVLDM